MIPLKVGNFVTSSRPCQFLFTARSSQIERNVDEWCIVNENLENHLAS